MRSQLLIAILAAFVPLACGASGPSVIEPTPTPAPGHHVVFDFEDDAPGSLPVGFSAALAGSGKPGVWQVVELSDGSSGRRAVAQTDADTTGGRFPLLVRDDLTAKDLELSVVGRPVSGAKDQAIGIVWRYQDQGNFYVVRANALEDNVVLYKMEHGKRSDLPVRGLGRTYGVDATVPKASWSRLGVRVVGEVFTVLFDGRELFQVVDATFPTAGKVGLWTKADSVTQFDRLEVSVFDAPAGAAP